MKGISKHLPRYLTGLIAVILACTFMVAERQSFPIFFASLFFLAICITDTLYAKIPNILTLSLAVIGLGYNLWHSGVAGLVTSLLGFALGLGLFLIPFMLGGMGAGDVKALAAVGAMVGPQAVFHVFLYTAIFGGALSVLHYIFNHNLFQAVKAICQSTLAFAGSRDKACLAPAPDAEKLRFPYAAAIAFGYFTFVARGGIL